MVKQPTAREARIAMNQFREEIAGELSVMNNTEANNNLNSGMNDILMENASNGMVYTNELPQDLD
ncbi:MAG: small, acid-soluble spore protein, alpha/beta type [Thermotaleaceae bacterium]